MKVHQYLLGPMDNFIYILEDEATQKVAVVDPAWEVPTLVNEIQTHGWTLDQILLTHAHHDHTNGVEELVAFSDVPVRLFHNEINYNVAPVFNIPNVPLLALHDGDNVALGNSNLRVHHTPGHSPGSVCFVSETDIIAGDLIFVNGCGRIDLPGGDPEQMFDSLQSLKALPNDLRVWSGHKTGAQGSALIGDLKQQNPYLLVDDRSAFFSTRGV